jgi:hypothetical protein
MDRHTTKREEAVSSSSTGEISTLILLWRFRVPPTETTKIHGAYRSAKECDIGTIGAGPRVTTHKKRKRKNSLFLPIHGHPTCRHCGMIQREKFKFPLSLSLSKQKTIKLIFVLFNKQEVCTAFLFLLPQVCIAECTQRERVRERDLIDIVWAATV